MVVITIDGPAATGKSTIARALACHFNFFYLSSGFLYRSFSYFLKLNNINYMNESEVVAKLNNCVIKYQNTDDRYALLTLCGIPVDLFSLDTQEIGVIASSVSAFMPVRKHFLHIQREIVKRENRIVLEGRDAGSVIWPQADVKIFLTASVSGIKVETKACPAS